MSVGDGSGLSVGRFVTVGRGVAVGGTGELVGLSVLVGDVGSFAGDVAVGGWVVSVVPQAAINHRKAIRMYVEYFACGEFILFTHAGIYLSF